MRRGATVLYWLALFYPAVIGLQAILQSLTAMARHVAGNPISEIRVGIFQISILNELAVRRAFTGAILASLMVAAILLVVRRRWPTLAAIALACTGLLLGGSWLARVWFSGQPELAVLPVILTSLLLLTGGLRLLAATVDGNYIQRAGMLAAGFAFPAFAIPVLSFGGRRGMIFAISMAIPAVLGCLIAPIRKAALPLVVPSRRNIAVACASAVLTFGLIAAASRALEDRKRESAEAALQRARSSPVYRREGRIYFHRGVNFTANGVRYDSIGASKLLAQLPSYNVRDIALVPYGYVDRANLRLFTAGNQSWETDEGIEILTAQAHRDGMRVMLKPHTWKPRQQDLPTPEHRQRWFAEMTKFLVHYARLADRLQVDTFCIGVEFGWLTMFEREWRELIASVRTVYPGPLVYAANHGEEFESIAFWDALDYIGVDNYYPLPDNYDATALARKISEVSGRFGRPVLFTETGYSSAPDSHRTPWDDKKSGPIALEHQARCYEALLSAFYDKPWFRGVYWWKIETDGVGGPDDPSMVPWRKPAMEVLRRWYGREPANSSGTYAPRRTSSGEGV